MLISRLNYEEVLIDYLDGKLNPSQVEELMAFLNKNPDIQEEFDGLQDAVLIEENIYFSDKTILKKNSFHKYGIDNEFEYLCISSIEGTISSHEQDKLNKQIKEDVKKEEILKKYQQIKFEPDHNILFRNKDSLKRLKIIPIKILSFKVAMSVAASVAIFIAVYSFLTTLSGKQVEIFTLKKSSIVASTEKNNTPIRIQEVLEPTKIKRNTKSLVIPQKTDFAKVDTLETSLNMYKQQAELVPNRVERKDAITISSKLDTPANLIAFTEVANFESKVENEKSIQLGYYNQYHTKEIGVFEIIQYGVKSIAHLMGREVKLEADKDKNGKIKKINFESNLIAFSAPIKGNE